jgi:small-conductance mechanosensitive channel
LALPAAAAVAAGALYWLLFRAPGIAGLRPGDPMLVAVRDIAGIAAWIAGAWFLARLFDLLLRRAALSAPRPVPYPRLLSDLVHGAIFVLAAVGVLVFVFEQAATGLIATSSVLIAVVGFALRYVISDVFSGIALSFDHPYRIGDWIEPAPGVVGKVVEITWRTTRLVTRDGVSVIVPNGLLATGRLQNYSAPAASFRAAFRLTLGPDVPQGRAKQILLAGALAATRIYPNLRPDVLAQECSEAGVVYAVRFWVPDFEQENACRDAVLSGTLEALRRAGLAPAVPRRELVSAERPGTARSPAEALLADTALFTAFSAEERGVLAERLVERRMRQGTIVVRQGDPASTVFFVREGVLEARIAAARSEPIPVNRLAAGDLFGEMSLLTGEPRSASIVALTDVVLYELGKEHLAPMLAQRPELGDALADLAAARQRWGRARIDALADAREDDPRSAAEPILRRMRRFFGLPDAG